MVIKEPIMYAKEACDTMMRTYSAAELPPIGRFHYHQGVFLSGVYKVYQIVKDEKYFEYIKDWVDSMVDEEGKIKNFDSGQLDDMQSGILLYPLLDRTEDQRYQIALDTLLPLIYDFPKTDEGGFWHMKDLPNQMWLDGLYMGGPICAEYGKRYHKPEYIDLIARQVRLMFEKTRDQKTGLLYHAWDGSKKAPWADKETGLSPEFWGRSIGWVPVAVLDDLDFMDENHPEYENMCKEVVGLLQAVCGFQSDEGLWYQVVDKVGEEGNWPETSCSCLFTAALAKAIRKGILSKDYVSYAKKGYQGVIESLTWNEGNIQIGNVCIGTGVGDYEHYCNRPTVVNDLHGVGAFLLMCEEMQQIWE